ncbi:ATP synthase F1 subunit epsilon [Candidatus Roizmanbacteria bacterium CG22_combo_CG10-13_8_21_14_all_35_9]|uniref:ATP synthase epsilon chain n=4 Tax=Candidatus Roizmaniibacteriota TaxID=1752723 RepID=A0A2M8F3N5_9BACT|nr:MAG: ATP synthase F1 subunit epsilon [Candidatus Roizmanbacteria bacterium CG23_combo_of_CG06-09_8_20_14_all_35_49]PIP63102.1 MAG: ATP synthase F1 subunit epsilon [Candidatus Roizmanbacteria bacterium CG22_combo_CG10-13_8_21_14_all_35_9]PIY70719.1 MAG: ATP synthase F1 subunit epsilon [Candidatus Roizmanbacteria bacterium CG_4_10_14_0_8_um_filter_35_28]PJC33913.1 MAG: ATP synthase F1 subunit epsilon [Candidatus Roizmanbacteria bacterium CG_4_9_14_0_2_um_filter_35_15]
MLHLRIITPKKIVLEEEVKSVTIPTVAGEITILPKHERLFSIISEGIIKIKKDEEEDYLSIGAGYLETDGKELNILVSRAYGQNEIDEQMITNATEEAKKILSRPASEQERSEAISMMRRAVIDSKLLKKRKKTTL